MKKGFTLIELLVVVLIIGILSAIALPMYTKAVNKARMAEPISVMKTIHQAMEVYHMANGEWPYLMEQLDMEIPQGDWQFELTTLYGGPTERESSEWPVLKNPRGRASIAAWNEKLGGGTNKGALFYSIPGRTAYNNKPGIFCCTYGSNTWAQFCNASKVNDDSFGSCYTGGKIPIQAL